MRLPVLVVAALAGWSALPAAAATVCTLAVEEGSGAVLERQGPECEVASSPASTFKIALAVIGYDSGILVDAQTPAWPYRDDYAAPLESWRKTVDPTTWLRDSVIWYSREITGRLGMERFQHAVNALDYGNRDLSGDPGQDNGLTHAWLSSSLKISPAEQVAFLGRMLGHRLPVSIRAVERTVAALPQFTLADGWTVKGKTGSGFRVNAEGMRDLDHQFGWFVGWAWRGGRTVIFARLIKDDAWVEAPAGPRARDGLLADLPEILAGR